MDKKLEQKLIDFAEDLANKQIDLEPEYQKIVSDNFWELIGEDEDINDKEKK